MHQPSATTQKQSRLRAALVYTLAAAGGSAILLAAKLELPPISSPPSSEHHAGKVIWVDLVTPDLDAAEKFYGGLFGWTFREFSAGEKDYAEASVNGAPVAGLFHRAVPAGQQRQPAWLTFFAVRDVGKAESVVKDKGGKVLSPPRTYAKRGRQAVFADPQGAVFAVLESSSGDPGDYLPGPGEWIWSSLITSDPNAGAAFYQSLFGYEVYEMATENHLLLASDGYSRASANPLPADKLHSHWLNYVRVASVKDTAAKAVALGGRVLVEPRVDRHGGMIAIVADPSGAPFGLLEWSETETKEVPK